MINTKCIDLSKEDFSVVINKFEKKRNLYKKFNPCLVIQILNQDKAEDILNNIIFHELNKTEYQHLKWVLISDKDYECDTNDIFKTKKLAISNWENYIKEKTSTIDIVIRKGNYYKEFDIPRTIMILKIEK